MHENKRRSLVSKRLKASYPELAAYCPPDSIKIEYYDSGSKAEASINLSTLSPEKINKEQNHIVEFLRVFLIMCDIFPGDAISFGTGSYNNTTKDLSIIIYKHEA